MVTSSEDMDEIVLLLFYMADEGGSVLSLGGDNMGFHDDHILAFGPQNDVGNWQLHLESKESWILEKQLDLISNKSTLWTNYGLRSLAETSSICMQRNTAHDPPYWRGQNWMNMNYLILISLHYYSVDGPYKDRANVIYNYLRNNLIRNVIRNHNETGYLWEQYDDPKKGKGKGARLFTGWTALIVLIMGEAYKSYWQRAASKFWSLSNIHTDL